MKITIDEHILPDIISTGCQNSIKLKDIEFPVPCGKCLPCQKKRRSDWSFRLEQEYLSSDSALFITLTYDDLHLPYQYYKNKQIKNFETGETTHQIKELQTSDRPTLNKKHLQDYIKRLRNDHTKYITKELGVSAKEVKTISKPLRYYAVGEYGTKTHRPHYHLLLFNMEIANIAPISNQWQHGFTDIGSVTGASINYVTKYMFKDFDKKSDTRQAPFSTMSKGRKNTPYGIIGYKYLENNGVHHLETEDLTVRTINGNAQRLPKAFLRRLFTDKQDRQQVSLNSYEEYKENKIKEYKRKLNKHYNNDHISYMISKDSDLKRKLKTINNNETL